MVRALCDGGEGGGAREWLISRTDNNEQRTAGNPPKSKADAPHSSGDFVTYGDGLRLYGARKNPRACLSSGPSSSSRSAAGTVDERSTFGTFWNANRPRVTVRRSADGVPNAAGPHRVASAHTLDHSSAPSIPRPVPLPAVFFLAAAAASTARWPSTV